MNRKLFLGLVTGLFFLSNLYTVRQAHAYTEEDRVTDTTRVNTLSKQYNVSPETVQQLRDKKQGWGEITTELAMSRQLTQTNPKLYPTMNDALIRIEAQRADHMGWGKIAKENGFKLGPVEREARDTRRELHEGRDDRREDRHERTTHEQVERVERSDRSEHTRVERPEALEHGKR